VAFKKWNECTDEQKVERWENVLRVLRSMTPHQRKKHFNMSTWAEKNDCGTIGCAAGLCSFDPWFRRRGFKGEFVERVPDDGPICSFRFANRMFPEDFFGTVGHERVFVNEEFTDMEGEYAGPAVHRKVLAAVRDYIKDLKSLGD
jgi:hypothetical protein